MTKGRDGYWHDVADAWEETINVTGLEKNRSSGFISDPRRLNVLITGPISGTLIVDDKLVRGILNGNAAKVEELMKKAAERGGRTVGVVRQTIPAVNLNPRGSSIFIPSNHSAMAAIDGVNDGMIITLLHECRYAGGDRLPFLKVGCERTQGNTATRTPEDTLIDWTPGNLVLFIEAYYNNVSSAEMKKAKVDKLSSVMLDLSWGFGPPELRMCRDISISRKIWYIQEPHRF
jgi:hypothetical protein